ncbi:IS200/IS605 family transposase [Algoriphagus halophilus]|uniref:IS200/IS605 family transposase n=1 Tax=Algoriphagus halophilus TaxID=226505 RepID=UPI00358F5B97
MANTYTQIPLHVIFATKFRSGQIAAFWEHRLFEYIIAIIQKHNHKVLAINGMPDHIHILLGLRPNQSLSELIQKVKASSSKWINENNFCKAKFAWHEGYSAFSYTKSHLPRVINYIVNQKTHHQKIDFLNEYKNLLTELEVEFDLNYIFKEPT